MAHVNRGGKAPPGKCKGNSRPRVTRTLSLLLLTLPRVALAHPGPGIVVDQQNQVYFVHPVRHRTMRVENQWSIDRILIDSARRKQQLRHGGQLER